MSKGLKAVAIMWGCIAIFGAYLRFVFILADKYGHIAFGLCILLPTSIWLSWAMYTIWMDEK